MTTTTADLVRPASVPRRWSKLLPPLAGLGLVAGLITLFVTPAGDETGETPGEVVAYATTHEGWSIALAFFGLLAIPLGGAFVAGLHARLSRIATPTESLLVLIGGVAFTLCFALCFLLWAAPLTGFPDDPARQLTQAEAYLALDDFGWFLFGAAGVGAALMAIPASVAAMRSRAIPTWLGSLGIAAGIGSLATIAFLGMFAWLAWIAVASLVLIVAAARD